MIRLMSGVWSTGTTLPVLFTTRALLSRPPSSVRRPTTWSFSGPRMMSLTVPTFTPSVRLRIGRPMSRLPLRITLSSRRLEEDEVGGHRQDHDQHDGGN